jgi:hypothetical protein
VGGKRDGRALLMAVDRNTWLVRAPGSPICDVTPAEWNDAVARHSDAMFIADHRCDGLTALAKHIGSARPEFSLAKLAENNPDMATKFREAMQSSDARGYWPLMTIGTSLRAEANSKLLRRYFRVSRATPQSKTRNSNPYSSYSSDAATQMND